MSARGSKLPISWRQEAIREHDQREMPMPAVLGQGREDRLGRVQRRRARLLRLAAPARARWGRERGGVPLLGAYPTGVAEQFYSLATSSPSGR